MPTVEVPGDHPAAMLALLPDSTMYAHINLESVLQRPDMQEHVEFQLSHFVTLDELPFAEEMLISVGADALLLSYLFRTYEWAIVLLGDFARLDEALGAAARSGVGLSVSVVDTHRESDIYALVRTKSSGRQSEIYLTVLDSEALAASPDQDAVRVMVDRHIDGGRLPEGLAAMVEDWGLGDLLEAFPNEGTGGQGTPLDRQRSIRLPRQSYRMGPPPCFVRCNNTTMRSRRPPPQPGCKSRMSHGGGKSAGVQA